MSMQAVPAGEKMVFRKTNRHTGRHVSVTPVNSTNRHLSYGRIILNASTPSVSFSNGNDETGLVCLSGAGTVRTAGQSFDLAPYDAIYIPRDSKIDVCTSSSVDLAEFSADVDGSYPVQFIRYAEVSKNPAFKFTTGAPGNQRDVNICIGKNVQAGRLLVGFTFSQPGNWTSWPPHEHAKMLEEMYVYFAMPEPAFGLQLVYNDKEYPELVVPVRDGDAVLMPSGYHPNVSVPGHTIGFLWAMAAHREKEDRQFGVVNVQPEFNQGGLGLEASHK
ncbi:MAG TPA: 5-deoxy-glucuronate isomerase [Candidatus Acidoferrum sp.]|nr:5-deoxy-glucuronate isomerase [Candidatus Acidoferrum sp.]